ncbi:deoxyribodipyrimidine photo-lyase [Thalassotalea piscium]|uniref:Deoxyribodipyrimidine photo-lyase n=1 Tax=Thalassotalea piscium TaxID=1230533 RepID=A0A7X0TTL6_9GAMM|nr:deoxyribodipyrimidine photo-lyase [Thalassotalea piscium]MBB6543254.1 deoxyribodipyrimidine photo-lyase [Thalassotalea piscium]
MILWFRNDLRTHDNPALHYFLNNTDSDMPRKAFFFISEKQWQIHHWSAIKIDFVKRHADALVQELSSLNIELELVTVDDFSEQVGYLTQFCRENKISQVVANSELEFNEQQRDQQLINEGIALTLFEADVIVAKGKVLNQSGKMFKVFTPFKKAWLQYVRHNGFEYLGKLAPSNEKKIQKESTNKSASSAWPLAQEYETNALTRFYQNKLSTYGQERDIPSIKGTSGISPYLAAGVISPRFVLFSLLNRYPDLLLAIDSPEFTWLNEIIWREFYRHLMFHEQRLCKNQCFNEKYQSVHWHNNQLLFNAWCEGKTGYPLVDAAMRQLNQTGWMHNRLRMVVASFLTKHLLIDWRLGEKYFMQHLIDGDLASNNGGWQWAASTGCDAQPYFRIFNPIRQSERFDPNGDFIRKYIPELKSVSGKAIHFPHEYIKNNNLGVYWPAIVDHKEARVKALAFYK